MKKNNENNYESLLIYLTPDKTPIAYQYKVECLQIGGATEEEAREMALEPIELELYYETGLGLFAVESDAVENSVVHSPYTKEELEDKMKEENEVLQLNNAYKLKALSEKIARSVLIELITQNGGKLEIPEHSDGQYALSMLGLEFTTFYFSTMEYDGKNLYFSGLDENYAPVDIYESELPDNGLLYLSDYLVNGNY